MKTSKTASQPKPALPHPFHDPGGDAGRTSRIALAAYYKAEARGFQPGHDLEDWLLAEAEEQ